MLNIDTQTLCLVIVIIILGIILIIINLPTDSVIETMSNTSPCPPGWSGSGTDSDPCKKVQITGQPVAVPDCASKSFNGIDWNGQRKWATQCEVKNWPGILCPPDWTGIGTATDPCIKEGNKCSPINFDTDEYTKDFTKIVKWADNCDVNWSGVTCPKNWTGRGIATNLCIPSDNNDYCRKVAFDFGYTQHKTVADWITECNDGSQKAKQNPIIMYSAGKWQ